MYIATPLITISPLMLYVLIRARPWCRKRHPCANNTTAAGDTCDGSELGRQHLCRAAQFLLRAITVYDRRSAFNLAHCVAGHMIPAANQSQSNAQPAIDGACNADSSFHSIYSPARSEIGSHVTMC